MNSLHTFRSIKMYDLEISISRTTSIAFKGCLSVGCELVVNDQLIEQVHSFNFFASDFSYVVEIRVDNKLEKFNHMCRIVKEKIEGKGQQR